MVVALEDVDELATRGTASSAYPVLVNICPQQVCSRGKTTVHPSRSSSVTVARGASGHMVSLKQVAKIATVGPWLVIESPGNGLTIDWNRG